VPVPETPRLGRSFAVALVTFATFTDIVAWAIAIPVLPDMSRRLGASPTTIGLLFASFGVTLVSVSIPAGALSDRTGRKMPIVAGLVALAAATLLFAFATSLPWLFAARLVQGAADGVTWVVGFALIADLYGPEERGRAAGIVMSGTSVAVVIGPSLGGWLYEAGGIRLPFMFVTLLAAIATAGFVALRVPRGPSNREIVPVAAVVTTPSVAACAAAVVVLAATLSMYEPVLALHLSASLGIGPARIGYVFGAAAVATAILNPIYGRVADRVGARRLTMVGLGLAGATIPLLSVISNYPSAIAMYVLQASMAALAITPSLAYMGEAVAEAGLGSFGVGYGLYNMAWGVGLLSGPAIGGFLYERLGFTRLTLWWAPFVVLTVVLLARTGRSQRVAPVL
jgi:MFS transporter, DHA1 family, solute carrier family 18 (vesicular amine transporter), member 1/2